MNPIQELIVELTKDKKKLNKAQLSRALGVNRSEITFYIKHGVIPKDDVLVRLADIAGRRREELLLEGAKLRAPEETRTAWAHIFDTFKKASNFMLGAAVVLGAVLLASPAEAAATFVSGAGSPLSSLLVRIAVVTGIHYATFKRTAARLFNQMRALPLAPFYSLKLSY